MFFQRRCGESAHTPLCLGRLSVSCHLCCLFREEVEHFQMCCSHDKQLLFVVLSLSVGYDDDDVAPDLTSRFEVEADMERVVSPCR